MNTFFTDKNLSTESYIYVLMWITLLCDGISFFIIRGFPAMQVHPMKIFMWLSCANFSFFWSLFFGTFLCEMRLDITFEESIRFLSPHVREWTCMNMFLKLVPFSITFWYNLVICLNCCLCLDLIWTLRSPFKNPESRYPTYLTSSILGAFIPAVLRVTLLADPEQ